MIFQRNKKKKTGYESALSCIEYYLGGALALTFFLRSRFFLGSCLAIILLYGVLSLIFRMSMKTTEKIMATGFFMGICGLFSYALYGWTTQDLINGFNIAYLFSYISVIIIGVIYSKKDKKLINKDKMASKNKFAKRMVKR